jgi:hypothetical protein
MLMMLEEMQAEAWDLGLVCSNDKVKKLFANLVLPAIGGFRTNRPKWVQTILTTPGMRLSGTVLSKWYDEACGLDSSMPLNSKENRNILAHTIMDPDQPVMRNSTGVLAAVPHWKRGRRRWVSLRGGLYKEEEEDY